MKATANAPTTSFSMTRKKLLSPLFVIRLRTKINNATPVPSLNRDSLSMTTETFLDRPSLFRIPVAAMGSVGDTILPSKIQVQRSIETPMHFIPIQNKTPKNPEESMVERSARRLMVFRLLRNFLIFTLPAPANSIKQRTVSIRYFSKPKSPIR